MSRKAVCSLVVVCSFLLIAAVQPCLAQSGSKAGGSIEMTSTAFQQGAMIPKQYTCSGKNISPPLAWSGVPKATKSIALIMDDPDALRGTYVHWVVYNLPPDGKGLPENVKPGKTIPGGGLQGVTTGKKNGYLGPCPPSGTHRYFFKLFALDAVLSLKSGASKQELEKAMEGHVLDLGQLMGTYKK